MNCDDYRFAPEGEIREHLIRDHGYSAEGLRTARSMAQVHIAEMEAR